MSVMFTPEQIKKEGYLLSYMSSEDITPEHCWAAVSCAKRKFADNRNVIDFIPRSLLTKEMCMDIVRQNGEALRSVPQEMIDREMCLIAVTQYGEALSRVPNEYKNIEMCQLAVAERGTALFYVPKEWITKELALIAVRTTPYAFGAVPEHLRDYDVCLRTLDHGNYNLVHSQISSDLFEKIHEY